MESNEKMCDERESSINLGDLGEKTELERTLEIIQYFLMFCK